MATTPIAEDRSPHENGSHESTTILLYLLGIHFLSLAKPVFEEIAKEAGKDIWTEIKALIAKLHKKQVDKSYQLFSQVYVFMELNDDFVAVEFRRDGEATRTTATEIERIMTEQLTEMAASWNDIQQMIKKFDVGVRRPQGWPSGNQPMIHIICGLGGKQGTSWEIRPISSAEFFENVRPRPRRDRN